MINLFQKNTMWNNFCNRFEFGNLPSSDKVWTSHVIPEQVGCILDIKEYMREHLLQLLHTNLVYILGLFSSLFSFHHDHFKIWASLINIKHYFSQILHFIFFLCSDWIPSLPQYKHSPVGLLTVYWRQRRSVNEV